MKPFDTFPLGAAPSGLKSFEMLPRAGVSDVPQALKPFELMTSSPPGMAVVQRSSKPYEMFPPEGAATKGGGCKCGENCGRSSFPTLGGEADPSKWVFTGATPFELPQPSYGPGGMMTPPTAMLPGATVCGGILDAIAHLRRERQSRLDRIGPPGVSDRVAQAWNAARRACAASTQNDLCVALGDLFTRSPLEGPGVAIRNAVWDLWSRCVLGQIDALRYRWFLCWSAIEYARAVEREAAERQGRTPSIDYERDIAPLDAEIVALEVAYQRCLTGAPSTSPPLERRTCQNIGSGGCSNGRKRCTYGNCEPPGAGCESYLSCGPGNWDPACPSSRDCY